MLKKEIYNRDLSEFFQEKNYEWLEKYMLENSSLPSPRANLELAKEFAIFFDECQNKDFYSILEKWININEDFLENDSKEVFLIFASLQAYWHIMACLNKDEQKKYLEIFEEKMNSNLWRVREACVIWLQDFWEKDTLSLLEYLNYLYNRANKKQKRAIFAILAHYPILKNKEATKLSLDLTDKILKEILDYDKQTLKEEDTRILLKTMEYVISVFIVFAPENWFKIIEKYLQTWNPITTKIIKKNLLKKRLSSFSEEVNNLNMFI